MSLSECLLDLCRRHDLVAIYAFGSRAVEAAARVRGGAGRLEPGASDLDIGVQPRPGRRLVSSPVVNVTRAPK